MEKLWELLEKHNSWMQVWEWGVISSRYIFLFNIILIWEMVHLLFPVSIQSLWRMSIHAFEASSCPVLAAGTCCSRIVVLRKRPKGRGCYSSVSFAPRSDSKPRRGSGKRRESERKPAIAPFRRERERRAAQYPAGDGAGGGGARSWRSPRLPRPVWGRRLEKVTARNAWGNVRTWVGRAGTSLWGSLPSHRGCRV